MRRTARAFAGWMALAGLCLAAVAAGATEATKYTVSLADTAQHRVLVRIDIPAGAVERDLQLPVWNAVYQIRDFSQHINWVRAKSGTGQTLAIRKMDKSRWHIEGAAQGAEIEYELFADDAGPFGAQLNSHHAFLNLAEVLMYPVEARGAPVTVHFDGLPAGWKIATAMTAAGGSDFSAENYDRMVDSPVEAGTFQESDFDDAGIHYRVVVDADAADYDMAKIVAMLRSMTAAAVSWMNDRPMSGYMFLYHFPRGPGGGGMEHAYCTAIDIPAARLSENPESLASVSAHEFFHLWNVKRIRPQSLEPVDYTRENYTPALWFSEGVTTTAGNFILQRAGLADEAKFLADLAGQIEELEQRPAHLTQSAEESSLDTWLERYDYYRSPERSISYYNKGNLLGLMLDLEVREASNGKASLREVLQWMNQNYAQKGKSFPDSDGVREAAETVSGGRLRWFFQKYVAGLEEIPWNEFLKTVGLRLDEQRVTVGDPEFVSGRRTGAAPVVLSVSPDSEAAHAGLQAGDSILEFNGRQVGPDFRRQVGALQPGDVVKLHVRTARGEEHELQWKAGSRQEVRYQVKDLENVSAQQRARRAAWLKGEAETQGEARP